MHNIKDLNIVFTDSGLGGLSIFAEFYHFLKTNSYTFPGNINLIFFNSLPENGNGYSRMSSEQLKVKTFNAALTVCQKLYDPTLICIACNTLSAIYHKTSFFAAGMQIHEIIVSGREQIRQYYQQYPEIPIFVLATHTTMEAKAYNFDTIPISQISGGNLASCIEKNPTGPKTRKLVQGIFEDIQKITSNNQITLFLGCTHYSYISDLFKKIAAYNKINIHTILNPAELFLDKIINNLKTIAGGKGTKAKINIKIESQAEISEEEIHSIGGLLERGHPDITKVLKMYKRLPKAF